MDEMTIGTITDITPAPAESNHPVLQQLKDRIAELEDKVTKANALDVERVATQIKLRQDKWNYEERVKNVLVEALENHDEETVKYIAEQLDIALTKTKQVEVNVTFTIDLEYEVGEEPDPEWDFDFSVSDSSIQDYSADVIYSKDV